MKAKEKVKLVFMLCLLAGLMIIFALSGARVWGQFNGEQPLSKIPDDEKFDSFRCGEYFLFGVTSSDDERIRIGIVFKAENDEPLELEAGAFLPEMFTVIFDEKKRVPTIRFIADGNGGSKIILKISHEEFNKSPCLQRCFVKNRT